MLILSALCAHVAVAGALMRPLTLDYKINPVNEKTSCQKNDDQGTDRKVNDNDSPKPRQSRLYFCRFLFCTNFQFTLLLVSILFAGSGMFGGILHLQPRAKNMQVATLQETAWLLSVLGSSGILGRVLGGVTVQRKILSATNVYILFNIIVVVTCMVPQLARLYAVM